MLEFKITVDEMDYDLLIEKAFPIISEMLEEKLSKAGGIGGFLGNIFGKTKEFSCERAKDLFRFLPDDKKESLITFCLNGKRDEFKKILSDALLQQGLSMKIDDFKISQVKKY